MAFDKRQTNIAKGIAILLLLWHHLFFDTPERYDKFVSVFIHENVPIECSVAPLFKVCVAIFLLLSGYGLFISYKKYSSEYGTLSSKDILKKDITYVKNHLLKLMSGFWFIYIIFVTMGFLFGRNPVEVYDGNVLYFLVDFLGLSGLFGTPIFNATWWFMGLIIPIYLLYPLIHKIFNYCPELLLVISFALQLCYFISEFNGIRLYLFSFVLGMYTLTRNLMDRCYVVLDTLFKRIFTLVIFLLIVVFYKCTVFFYSLEIDGLVALDIVMICFLILSQIPILSTVLEFLGTHSGSIFMFHTFIYYYYFEKFVYSFKYSLLIYVIFIVVCAIISVIINYLKKVSRYNKLFKLMC